jgi:hypothetical protein
MQHKPLVMVVAKPTNEFYGASPAAQPQNISAHGKSAVVNSKSKSSESMAHAPMHVTPAAAAAEALSSRRSGPPDTSCSCFVRLCQLTTSA